MGSHSLGINDAYVLVMGTLTLLMVVLFVIFFAFLFQRKMMAKQKAYREIESLLQTQEVNATYAVLDAQEQERKRIAQDLHDRLGSRLAAVKLYLQAGKRDNKSSIDEGIKLLDGAVEEVREISHNLISGALSKFGLAAALQELKNSIEASKQISFHLQVYRLHERLGLKTEVNLYRIIQELVSNILKHAKANEITVQINKHGAELLLIVEDDGIGFDLENKNNTPGIGLKNIKSRVAKLQGSISINSSPGKGTTISIELPITDDQYSHS